MIGGNLSFTLSLIQVFSQEVVPAKSSLSSFRQTVSYIFFKEIFKDQVKQFGSLQKTWKGLNVLAIDGDQYTLPATEEVLNRGYKGSPVKNGRETYYPKMYVSTVYDVLSGLIVDFAFSPIQNEIGRVYDLIKGNSGQTLILYDRLYFNVKLVCLHYSSKSFFLCRLKNGSRSLSVVKDFIASGKGFQTVFIEGHEVHLIRYKNPKTGGYLYFATNLPKDKFTKTEVAQLYSRRWDIETSFRDLSLTMGLEKWHSKSVNGILQEIYVGLWLFNQAKLIELQKDIKNPPSKLNRKYQRPCFKSILYWLLKHLLNLESLSESAVQEFDLIIKHTLEKRKRLTRCYERGSKQSAKKYSKMALVPRRA